MKIIMERKYKNKIKWNSKQFNIQNKILIIMGAKVFVCSIQDIKHTHFTYTIILCSFRDCVKFPRGRRGKRNSRVSFNTNSTIRSNFVGAHY